MAMLAMQYSYCISTWSISPRLIVRWKDTKMAASNKLFIVKSKQRISWTEKLRMKYNLNKQLIGYFVSNYN